MLKSNLKLALAILIICAAVTHAQDSLRITKEGHIGKSEIFNLLYVPLEVPEGINRIAVKELYNQGDDQEKNVLNIGIYDSRGFVVGDPEGFRGWSGGAKTSFFIANTEASTGYIPGKIQSGTWHILIYPSDITETGIDWKLEVTLWKGEENDMFQLDAAQNQINNEPGWYNGDLHMHTLHSDGKRTTKELVEEAKSKNLDFIISTEHNTNSANLSWGKFDSKELLIINGEEVTSTKYGHWNAIGLKAETYIDWRYEPDTDYINKMIEKVHKDDGLAIMNHPFYHRELKNTVKYDNSLFDGVEVWNGNWNLLDSTAVEWWNKKLIEGKKLIAIGASDTHVSKGSLNNLGSPQTVVFSKSLSKGDIIKGIKNGKAYIRATNRININFQVISGEEKAMLGDTIRVHGDKSSISIKLDIKNCEAQNLKIYSNLGILKEMVLDSDNEHFSFKVDDEKIKFLRLEIRTKENAMLALTNPIFIIR
jgi:predicted metal-dependent phosphoesterase TrpH